MSAIIVLILRMLLTISLFAFLVTALIFFMREMKQVIRQIENQRPPSIVIQKEGSDPKVFSQKEILIGRDPQNDFILEDETISIIHARVYYAGNHWMVEDSQSTNGTFLNDERILAPTILVENDIIGCGKIKFKISH